MTGLVCSFSCVELTLCSLYGAGDAEPAEQAAAVYKAGVNFNWLYGIPAVLLMALWLLLFAGATDLLFTPHLSIDLLRYMLNQTSAGRAITAERYRHRDENRALTRY